MAYEAMNAPRVKQIGGARSMDVISVRVTGVSLLRRLEFLFTGCLELDALRETDSVIGVNGGR